MIRKSHLASIPRTVTSSPSTRFCHPFPTPEFLLNFPLRSRHFSPILRLPFINSTSSDSTGYGHHADYVFGWEGDALHCAMSDEGCMTSYPGICEVLTRRSDEEMARCRLAPSVEEVTEGQCKLEFSLWFVRLQHPRALRSLPWIHFTT